MTMDLLKPIVIEYPQFPEEIQISEKRRPTYFEKGDKLPLKYCAPASALGRYIFKKHPTKRTKLLYDTGSKDWVVKNPVAVGTPRYISIAGNKIMRMPPHLQDKIVAHLVYKAFMPKLANHVRFDVVDGESVPIYAPLFQIPWLPIQIDIEIHTFPRFMNWDLDNLWIYNKCFQDALKTGGLIPDDNIRIITKPGIPEFFPISREEDRKMVFTISPDSQARRANHLMYTSLCRTASITYVDASPVPDGLIDLDILDSGHAGDVVVNLQDETTGYPRITLSLGKKEKSQDDIQSYLVKVRHQCFQVNMRPFIDEVTWKKFETSFTAVFLAYGIPVFISKEL